MDKEEIEMRHGGSLRKNTIMTLGVLVLVAITVTIAISVFNVKLER
jgi:hypothetical protein